jgi:hypothetical protein
MDIKEIVRLYVEEQWTLRMIAEKMATNHHMIKRILARAGVSVESERKTLKPYTDEHRRKVGIASLGRKTNLGKKMPRTSLYKNMLAHLGYKVTLEWLLQYDDVEKLKYLNHSIARDRDRIGFTDTIYMAYIERFYYDANFNFLYERWLASSDKWQRPSLDHVTAKCKGGTCLIDNLQFLTWFENRAKMDMTHAEWQTVKGHLGDYLS